MRRCAGRRHLRLDVHVESGRPAACRSARPPIASRRSSRRPLVELKPVYLVQPEPEARTFSRRTLVLGLAAAALGGAAVGSVTTGAVLGWKRSPALDAQVQWAIDLQEGPIDELRARHLDFLAIVAGFPSHASLLRSGLRRLGHAVDDPNLPDSESRALAQALRTAIDALRTSDPELLEIARRTRGR
ncbi:MAG: hypothetical protein HZB39_06285 [Planctomycetes bacterium]|nr:hypothetical protein [Planctomycetota bacterium]